MIETIELTVVRRTDVTQDVAEFELRPRSGEGLVWSPGAHLEFLLPSGLVRHYSIVGAGLASPQTVRIAVLRQQNGRGGSVEVHETLQEGSTVLARGPRNNFELVDAPHYLFLAGGIGITPILAMAREATRAGATWQLHYGGRDLVSMPYVSELQALDSLCEETSVHLVPQDEQGLIDLRSALAGVPMDGVVYACGPQPMLEALEEVAADVLGDARRLRLERFEAKAVAVVEGDGALDCFEVEIASTGQVLQVKAGESIIDVVRTVRPETLFSCKEGYCGTCETAVVEGLPAHRDSVLSEDERAANETMMICVGGSRTPRLKLEL